MPPKEDVVETLAHDLLTRARDNGGSDEAWDSIFTDLLATPAALVKPAVRKMSLLHQAAYWGHKSAVNRLLTEFNADVHELTTDGQDAAAVAEDEGNKDLAKVIRDFAAKPKLATKSLKRKAPSDEEISLAHELLNDARDNGGVEKTWESIFSRLRSEPGAIVRPEVRKYSLLHQAAHWGNLNAVKVLIEEFGADLKERSADGQDHEASDIAESQGHGAVAAVLRAAAKDKGAVAKSAAVAGSAGAAVEAAEDEEEVDEDDGSTALSPYSPEKVGNSKEVVGDDTKGVVEVWLVLAKGAEPKWEPYTRELNASIAEHRKGPSSSKPLKIEGKTLDLEARIEEIAGKKRKLQSFKVLWEWDSGLGGKAAPEWQPYPQEAQWRLEAAICAADATCEVSIGGKGSKYFVDLVAFRQYSAADSFRCRRVRRRGVALRVTYPPRVRDMKTGLWLDLTYQPDYWMAVKGGAADANTARRFDLPPNSPLIPKIAEWMNSTIRSGHAAAYGQVPGGATIKGLEVVRVEVVQHPSLWRRYCCYRGELKSRAKEIKSHDGTAYFKKHPMAMPKCDWLDGDINEAYFWHGSGKSPDGKIDLIDAIVSVGHEPSDENSAVMEVADGASSRFAKASSMFGSGVYLADISSKANLYVPCPVCHGGAYFRDPCHCSMKEVQASQPYRMLLCRAALGKVHIEKKYKDDRYKGDFNPAKKLAVDSVMGEAVPGTLAFREYVVYSDSASYPEFIVHYWRHAKAIKPGGPAKKKAKTL